MQTILLQNHIDVFNSNFVDNFDNMLGHCEEYFRNDMFFTVLAYKQLGLNSDNINPNLSIKEEANTLVSYVFKDNTLKEYLMKEKIVDDNTLDEILDDSFYYLYNWLLMKFTIPTEVYKIITSIISNISGSVEWNNFNPIYEFENNHEVTLHNEYLLAKSSFLSSCLEGCSDELKEYIQYKLPDLILNDEWFNCNENSIEVNSLLLQEYAFAIPFKELYKENMNFLYSNEGVENLLFKVSNRTTEVLHLLNNLYK